MVSSTIAKRIARPQAGAGASTESTMQRDLSSVLGKLGLTGPGHTGEAAADARHEDEPAGAENAGTSLLFRGGPDPADERSARPGVVGRGNGRRAPFPTSAAPSPNGAHHRVERRIGRLGAQEASAARSPHGALDAMAPGEIERAIARIDVRRQADLQELRAAVVRFYEPRLTAQDEQLADLRRQMERAERERDALAGRIDDLQRIAAQYGAELRTLSELSEGFSRRAGAGQPLGETPDTRVTRDAHNQRDAGMLFLRGAEPAVPAGRSGVVTAPGAGRGLVAAAKERARGVMGKRGAHLRELVQTLLLALVLFVGLRTLGFNVRVEGASMQPGFQDGQYLLINKLVYFHFDPHVLGRLLGRRQGDPDAVYLFHPPQRGDVVILRPPGGSDQPYVKRVIALPGETVAVRGGTVFVDGRALDEPYIVDPARYTYPLGASGDGATFTVPAGSVFVLGDNRNHSTDSHVFGPVPLDDIIGKAAVSYWPLGDIGPIAHQRYATAGAGE